MENWKILNTENFIKLIRKEDEKMKIKEAEDDKEVSPLQGPVACDDLGIFPQPFC